jgi:SAM-dependent methyltransferase
MWQPEAMARQRVEFGQGGRPPPEDGRLDAPAFHRNNGVITARLLELLKGRRGDVLEVGSGTGQHVLAFARAMRDLNWWPSDGDPDRLASIEAWRRHSGPDNLRPAALLDVTKIPWAPDPPGMPLDGRLAMIVAINVVHIAPWEAAVAIFRGAEQNLNAGGHVVFYGPFKREGAHTAPSNAAFDAELRVRDPAWGIRDQGALAACARNHGLALASARDVPANNMILVFDKLP